MTSRIAKVACWFAGPALAIALIAFALIGGGGPGFVLLALVAGALFLIGVPLAQVVLLRTPKFKGRHAAACGTALLIAVGSLPLIALLGNFNIC